MENTQANMQPPKKSGLAIAGMVLGIVAIATSFLPIINNGSFFLALIGLIFAIVGMVSIRKGKSSGMGMAVAGLVLSIVAIVVVLGSQAFYSAVIDEASNQATQQLNKMSGDATNDIMGVDVDVAIGDFSISKDGYGFVSSELPVTVTNLLDEQTTYWITIEAVDGTGARITDDTVYVNDLGANQSTTLKAFAYVSSDDYAAMQNARFNIVSVSEM